MIMANTSDNSVPRIDLSREEIEKFIERFEECRRDFDEMLASMKPHMNRRLAELAGADLENMLSSPGTLLRYLTDPDPKLREAALKIASGRAQFIQLLAPVYEGMALSDPISEVRDEALRALGTAYARTKDKRIGYLLAEIIRDNASPESLRLTAFCSLLRLHGNLDYLGPSPLVATSLEQIDWAFVGQYHTG